MNARTWVYHSLGGEAGVDFSFMLYADQAGLPVPVCKGRPGVGWVRMTTDIPAVLMGILSADTNLTSCLDSLRKCNAERFSLSDPVPGLAEVALIRIWRSKGASETWRIQPDGSG